MRFSALFAAAGIAVANIAVAANAATPAAEINVKADGLAAGGYDVTSYFTEGKPVQGSAAFETQYKGATWRFASPEAKVKFEKSPATYAPQFGGHCAWATSQGYVAPGDPETWKIVDGKLYLNYNARAKELWEADQDNAIAQGHANWPTVLLKGEDNQ